MRAQKGKAREKILEALPFKDVEYSKCLGTLDEVLKKMADPVERRKLLEDAKVPLTFSRLKKKTGVKRQTLFDNLKRMVREHEVQGKIDAETLGFTNGRLDPVYVKTGMRGWSETVPIIMEGTKRERPVKITIRPSYELRTIKSTKNFDYCEVFKRVRKKTLWTDKKQGELWRSTGVRVKIRKRYVR
jgi:hypothetical protein